MKYSKLKEMIDIMKKEEEKKRVKTFTCCKEVKPSAILENLCSNLGLFPLVGEKLPLLVLFGDTDGFAGGNDRQ